jgi:hypothetical protein
MTPSDLDIEADVLNSKIIELMTKVEHHYDGYPRPVILIASLRIIAAMLGPYDEAAREFTLGLLEDTVRSYLKDMDSRIKKAH